MMPDLGKYATEVLLAYGVSIAVLGVIVALSVAQSRAVARRLDMVEKETKNG